MGAHRKAGTFMHRISASVLAALAFAAVGIAGAGNKTPQPTSATCRGAISWQNARKYVGRTATIRGPVAGAVFASSSNGSPTFLNLGVDYPSSRRFTVVIWGENRGRFGTPERRYKGRTICVRGFVGRYAGIPQIEATSPAQIAVVR